MQYQNVLSGRFLVRPNRFIAHVETAEGVQVCHVKNTGRCRELLVPGATVYLEPGRTPGRRTAFDLIAVEKGDRLINMDAQAPNRVFEEWARAGGFSPEVTDVRREVRWGDSRLDFCLERGVKHILELARAVEEGLDATLFFVVQMEDIHSVSPNDETHPAFGEALRFAVSRGVHVQAYDCRVTPESIAIRRPVPVIL